MKFFVIGTLSNDLTYILQNENAIYGIEHFEYDVHRHGRKGSQSSKEQHSIKQSIDAEIREKFEHQDVITSFRSMSSKANGEYYLKTQMRSRGGKKYIDYINGILSNRFRPEQKEYFGGFEAKIFDNIKDFSDTIKKRESEYGLSRMVAGFAWKWTSKNDKNLYDIEIDGMKFRWNSIQDNWIGSKKSVNEVGSIYTVQGDDLNYVGIIIGNDLIYRDGKLIFNRESCADSGAMKRSQRQVANKEKINEDDMLEQVLRTYRILMNRAVKGIYIYACDENLRKYLEKYFDK